MSKTTDIGYLINIGITTCRLFKVHEDESLKEDKAISYELAPEDEGYFEKLIDIIQSIVKTIPDNFLVKVIVDTKFAELFNTETDLKVFIRNFYIKTNLYFNILTQNQTETNLHKIFGKITEDTGIINIGGRYVDIMTLKNGKIDSVTLRYSLTNVAAIIKNAKGLNEILTEENVKKIKKQIQKGIKRELKDISVSKAIIIKDELTFMKDFDYPLLKEKEPFIEDHEYTIDFDNYKKANREKLFFVNFQKVLQERNYEKTKQNRLYGFKHGHLLLEAIFELINVKTVIPSDLLNIHGSINSYIYNVVLSGSTNKEHAKFFFEAAEFVKKLGAKIISPQLKNKEFYPITWETDYAHLKAIEDCDILFVCNKDGYIGETTACEIYYASALRKTIVFWAEPDATNRLKCIPHEHWKNIKIVGVHS